MLKKVVSLIVGVACLVSMTGVFAATYTGTSTAYVGDKIEVTSYVTGSAGETVTYLVHDAEVATADITGGNVVYIDQYEFTGEETSDAIFKYQTDTADVGATLLVGGDATAAEGADAVIPDAAYKVVDAEGKVYWGKAALPEGAIKAFPLTGLAAGSIVTAVAIDGTAAETWYVSDTADKTLYIADSIAGETATITITVAETVATAAKTVSIAYFDADSVDVDDDATGASVAVIGEVAGAASEFGIILASSEADLKSAVSTGADVENKALFLKALAKNDAGQFAIRVYDEASFAGYSELFAIAYYKDAAGAIYVADSARKISIKQ